MFKNLLKRLWIIQEVSNKDRNPKLGRGFLEAHRLNPYNPLSYLIVILVLVVGILLFGFVGVWKQIDSNPFKWD